MPLTPTTLTFDLTAGTAHVRALSSVPLTTGTLTVRLPLPDWPREASPMRTRLTKGAEVLSVSVGAAPLSAAQLEQELQRTRTSWHAHGPITLHTLEVPDGQRRWVAGTDHRGQPAFHGIVTWTSHPCYVAVRLCGETCAAGFSELLAAADLEAAALQVMRGDEPV